MVHSPRVRPHPFPRALVAWDEAGPRGLAGPPVRNSTHGVSLRARRSRGSCCGGAANLSSRSCDSPAPQCLDLWAAACPYCNAHRSSTPLARRLRGKSRSHARKSMRGEMGSQWDLSPIQPSSYGEMGRHHQGMTHGSRTTFDRPLRPATGRPSFIVDSTLGWWCCRGLANDAGYAGEASGDQAGSGNATAGKAEAITHPVALTRLPTSLYVLPGDNRQVYQRDSPASRPPHPFSGRVRLAAS
jgi:hypothetical protein